MSHFVLDSSLRESFCTQDNEHATGIRTMDNFNEFSRGTEVISNCYGARHTIYSKYYRVLFLFFFFSLEVRGEYLFECQTVRKPTRIFYA